MPKELISMQEYCRRYNKSPDTVKGMIARGEIEEQEMEKEVIG